MFVGTNKISRRTFLWCFKAGMANLLQKGVNEEVGGFLKSVVDSCIAIVAGITRSNAFLFFI